MRVCLQHHPFTRSRWRPGVHLVALAALLAALPVLGAAFPQTLVYDGQAVDLAGQPLAGTQPMTLRYFDPAGVELFAESVASVEVTDGRFRVELGTGTPAAEGRYGSLGALFAAQPEVELEIEVGETTYAPRVGILPAGHSLATRLKAAGLAAPDDGRLHWKGYDVASGATAVQAAILAPAGTGGGGGAAVPAELVEGAVWRRPYTLPVVGPMLSRPVSELPIVEPQPFPGDQAINPPRHESLYDAAGNRFGTTAPAMDDYLAGMAPAEGRTPSPLLNFEGINNVSGVYPPDTEGAVGPNHYIQVVNLVFSIYDRSGTRLSGPSNTNTLWAGFGGPCQTDNSGDAIFLYDQQADRFVLTQFAVASGHQSVCFAVSQTSNPLGSYYLYEVVTPRFPDYYKVGVWPDASNNAYFFGTNSGYQSQYDVFAVDRGRMLLGQTARSMQFFQNFKNLMMPADVDGATGPPAGTPGLIYSFRDGGEPYFSSPPTDSLDIYQFHVDWTTPSSSTLTLVQSITPAQGLADFIWTVCGFFVQNCIPQPGTTRGLDSASWWPMQRLVYRNFGSHQTLLGAWTVDTLASGNHAAPRWFELRNSGGGWSIYQQGTHSPDSIHRWMPSVAMDGSGNIAMGYSRGDASNYASIYFATRLATDPLGTLQSEVQLFAGTGAQTGTASRWGDYSSMELDPADDCTFWYTNEYIATTGTAPWRTRIGTFKIPGCGGGGGNVAPTVAITAPANGSSFLVGTAVTFSGSATDPEDGNLSAGLSWSSSLDGVIGSGASFTTSSLSVGTHTITASVTDSGGLPGSAAISLTIDPVGGPVEVTFISVGAEDGWVRESSETSNQGGTASATGTNSSAIRAGDDSRDRQYKAFVSFDTSSIPDGATILSATVRLLRGSLTGTNPFTTHGSCLADVQNGGFGGNAALATSDFQASATAVGAATMSDPGSNGSWSEGTLNAAGLAAISRTGRTQIRVYFSLDDNDDRGNDYVGFYSGENGTAANRPQLVVTYQ